MPSRRSTGRSRGPCGRASTPSRLRGGGPDRPHHQRRPRRGPGWRPRCATSTTATSGRSGPSAAASPRSGSGSTSVDDGELWETHQILKSRLISFVRHRAVRQAERRGEPKEVIDALPPRPEPRRPDDRLRAAVRHLQAGQPDLPRPRADGVADQRPAVPGPVRLRRQGPSRSTSPASRSSARSPRSPATPSSPASWSSSKTTT